MKFVSFTVLSSCYFKTEYKFKTLLNQEWIQLVGEQLYKIAQNTANSDHKNSP